MLRRRMDARRFWSGAGTAARRPWAWRTMMRRARRMDSRRLRPRRMNARRLRRAMMRRARPDHRRANNGRPNDRRPDVRRPHMRRTIDRWAQMMMPPRHQDRHRQHDRRRARQPLQIILRDPAFCAGVIDLAPALRAAFDLDRRVARQRGDHRIVGARPFAQIDIGGGDRRRCIRSGRQNRRKHRGGKTESKDTHTHCHPIGLRPDAGAWAESIPGGRRTHDRDGWESLRGATARNDEVIRTR